jgi:hypothetical protein
VWGVRDDYMKRLAVAGRRQIQKEVVSESESEFDQRRPGRGRFGTIAWSLSGWRLVFAWRYVYVCVCVCVCVSQRIEFDQLRPNRGPFGSSVCSLLGWVRMHACLHVRVCVCMCVYGDSVRLSADVCIHAYIWAYLCMYVCMCGTDVCIYVCTCRCMLNLLGLALMYVCCM